MMRILELLLSLLILATLSSAGMMIVMWYVLKHLFLFKKDTLVVGGGFTKVGDYDGTSVARFNGWYFDTNYHVQVCSVYFLHFFYFSLYLFLIVYFPQFYFYSILFISI